MYRVSVSSEFPRIKGSTRVFCVLGHPVSHSRSPAMQNAALASMGIDGVYVAFDVPPESLAEAVSGLKALGVGGVNCTVPHKEAALDLCDALDDEAALLGAVNTLVIRDGRIIGHNTDGHGFLSDLRSGGWNGEGEDALVLGAGGAARAVVASLGRICRRVVIANRTRERAEALAREFNEKLGIQSLEAIGFSAEDLGRRAGESNLIVNTTTLGMSPRFDEMPPLPPDCFRSGQLVYDLIYNPLETRLLRVALAAGARGMHGAGMLAHQGARALELWTGREAPAELMKQTVLSAL
jgi:shikimate dehydrogenase